MKLIKTHEQPPRAGLPTFYREWWDIGDGYEIYVSFGKSSCTIGIDGPEKNITYEVARLLSLDISEESLINKNQSDKELFVQMGIDCVVIIYKRPKNYMELLKKIENIIDKNFKK